MIILKNSLIPQKYENKLGGYGLQKKLMRKVLSFKRVIEPCFVVKVLNVKLFWGLWSGKNIGFECSYLAIYSVAN